jgi:hypothetical protein
VAALAASVERVQPQALQEHPRFMLGVVVVLTLLVWQAALAALAVEVPGVAFTALLPQGRQTRAAAAAVAAD